MQTMANVSVRTPEITDFLTENPMSRKLIKSDMFWMKQAGPIKRVVVVDVVTE